MNDATLILEKVQNPMDDAQLNELVGRNLKWEKEGTTWETTCSPEEVQQIVTALKPRRKIWFRGEKYLLNEPKYAGGKRLYDILYDGDVGDEKYALLEELKADNGYYHQYVDNGQTLQYGYELVEHLINLGFRVTFDKTDKSWVNTRTVWVK